MKNIKGYWLPDSDLYFSRILLETGSFEADRLDIALKYVTQYRLALDIGAHIGLRSRELSPRFSAVYAFEPNLTTYCCLVENISFLGNITAFNVALGAKEGEVAMMESTTRPGNSGSYFCTAGTGTRLRTLDSFGFKAVDFIKIDVEGFELFVLQGGEHTIRESHPVLLLEQKRFTDHTGRLTNAIDHRAAGQLLETWGATKVETIKNDVVYAWT